MLAFFTATMEDPLSGAVEVVKDRLYYAPLQSAPLRDATTTVTNASTGQPESRPIHYFCIDQDFEYYNFYLDFGPFNLGHLYQFCRMLNEKLDDSRFSNHVICYYSSAAPTNRTNAAYLICAWQVLYMNKTPEESFAGFTGDKGGKVVSSPPRSVMNGGDDVLSPIPFHDATQFVCTYDLTVLDCIRGLAKARAYGFFDFSSFDLKEYRFYEQVENGDLNWILYGKIVAFAGPERVRRVSPSGHYALTPSDLIPYFKKRNIGLVVRLNEKRYDERDFVTAGIDFCDSVYPDGSCPPMSTLRKVVAAFESVPSDKGFAVHCKAGLGRTGTMIGAYLMKHYRLTAAEAIGWMRICRPGMVIGPQQQFLEDIEQRMWHEGSVMTEKPARSLFGSMADRLLGSRQSSESSSGSKRRSDRYDKTAEGVVITKDIESLSVDGDEEDVVVPVGGEEIVGQGDALIARRLEADRRIKEKAKAGLV